MLWKQFRFRGKFLQWPTWFTCLLRKWLNECISRNWQKEVVSKALGESLQIDMIGCMVCQTLLKKSNANDVWHEKCCGEKFPEPSKTPPIKDELRQHVKRVNYQAFVWKTALEANQETPETDQHGWAVRDGTYEVHRMGNQTSPDKIELVICDCKKGKCIEICKCKGECQNEVRIISDLMKICIYICI